jgi:hypothetical protein
MMLTDKQKKALWITALVLAVIHFAPQILFFVRQAVFAPHAPAYTKPSPMRPMPQPAGQSLSPVAPAPPVNTNASRFLGVWTGSELMPSQDTCKERLEVRMDEDKPGFFSGSETRVCTPALFALPDRVARQRMSGVIRQMEPVSAELTGSMENGAITFKVDKTIGIPSDGCTLTGYSISAFGLQQIAAQWQQGSCPGGQLILVRAQR